MGYQNRRYRVVDGKLAKRWDGADEPGWFVTKVEAWAAVNVPPAPPTFEEVEEAKAAEDVDPPRRRGRPRKVLTA